MLFKPGLLGVQSVCELILSIRWA